MISIIEKPYDLDNIKDVNQIWDEMIAKAKEGALDPLLNTNSSFNSIKDFYAQRIS